MRVLIVKTSSMGDVIHTLPALTDAGNAIPGIQFDWMVEKAFAEIPAWHPLVNRVIPISLRRWRKHVFSSETRQEWRQFRSELKTTHYDLIIDAQGLVKSALLTRLAKGKRWGYSWTSIREALASLFYRHRAVVQSDQHAIHRVRQLFSQALGYTLPTVIPDYGIDRARLTGKTTPDHYFVFLHATTWDTKHWPEQHWIELATIANQAGYAVKLPWGTAVERERALRIAAACPAVEVLPKLDLLGVAKVLAGATAAVAVDTGLGHLSAALAVPTVSLYGPTDAALSGALGQSQIHLQATFPCAPCFSRTCTYQPAAKQPALLQPACFAVVSPELVWGTLVTLL